MRKIVLIFVAITLVTIGCKEDKGYSLNGNISGLEDGKKVYVAEYDAKTNATKAVDTTTVKNGKFNLDMEEQDLPNLSFLRFEGVNGKVIFISENQEVSFEIDKDSLRNAKIKGGKENKGLSEYINHLHELNRKMAKMQQEMRQSMVSRDTAKLSSMRETQLELRDNDENFKKELFNRSKDSYVSVMLLTDMLQMRTLSSGEIREMYEDVSDRIKETPMAQNLKQTLEKYKAAEIGSKAPEFTGPTPQGEELALKNNLGRVTIVDFWAVL